MKPLILRLPAESLIVISGEFSHSLGYKRPPTSPAVQNLFEAARWLQFLRFEIAIDISHSIAEPQRLVDMSHKT